MFIHRDNASSSAWCRVAACALLLVPLFWASLSPADGGAPEYRLKAALIYKIANFVEWPKLDSERFDICLLGIGGRGRVFDALEGREMKGSRIRVRHFTRSDDIGDQCRIVFIGDSKRPFLRSILDALGGRSLLTIGESPDFAVQGGMIQFVRSGNRIGFKINRHEADAVGLKIAAPLLQLATIVDTETRDHEP